MTPDENRKRKSDWELEASFDRVLSLEELINLAPFKEASDSIGSSHVAGSRVPTWLHRRIIYLTEMKGTPYHIQSDVVRDAIYVGMKVISQRYKLSPDWGVEARMAKAIDKVGVVKRIRSQVYELAQGLEEMVSNKDAKQAIDGLEDYLAPVLELEDEWHRNKIIQNLMDIKTTRELLDKCSDETRIQVLKIYADIKKTI